MSEPERPLLELAACTPLAFDTVQQFMKHGQISVETWEAYCWEWRDRTYRFSGLGTHEAARHAARAGVPLPKSDRALS